MDVGGCIGCWAGRLELGDGNLDIDCANLVGSCVLGEAGDRVELRKVAGQLGGGGLVCRHGGERLSQCL